MSRPVAASKKRYPTHFSLLAAMRRKGFIADMLDTDRFTHADGRAVRASFNGGWTVRESR